MCPSRAVRAARGRGPAALVAAIVGIALPFLTQAVLAHEPEGRGTVEWKVETSYLTLGPDRSGLYLRMRLRAAAPAAKGRPTLILALVLDRSGSMKEEAKIGYLREAAHLVVDNLTPQDHVAFVAYNDRVEVPVPMQRAVNREYLHHRIEELHAEGYTNLSGGLLEGCAEVDKSRDEPGRHHLILLTDGLANRGVTDVEKLERLVQRCSAGGTTVTTIGVGADYDERLLRRVAEAGGGRYVHVGKPDQIPAAFQQELGALLAVVAQNVKLTVDLPAGIEVERLYGSEELPKPGPLEIRLGDLASGDEQVLLAKLRAAPGAGATGPIQLRASITYDDIAEARRAQAEQTLSIERGNAREAGGPAAGPLLAYARLIDALDRLSLAVTSMDRRLTAEVSQIRKQEYPSWKQAAVASEDQDFVNKAFLFEHFARELDELVAEGALHEHSEERALLQKEIQYRRYLRDHHKPPE